MADIDTEIAAYNSMQAELEASHTGEWVVIHDGKLIATYNSFESAAGAAVARFGRGPYLLRQVGAPPLVLSAAVSYRPVHGQH